jgi:hypothetical protein
MEEKAWPGHYFGRGGLGSHYTVPHWAWGTGEGADEDDAAWQTREQDFAPVKMSYDLDKAK